MKKRHAMTLEDAVHYVIFRELDICGVPDPYNRASRVCRALRAVVKYRSVDSAVTSTSSPTKVIPNGRERRLQRESSRGVPG